MQRPVAMNPSAAASEASSGDAELVADVVGGRAIGRQAVEVVALAARVHHRKRHRRQHLVAERQPVLAHRLAVGAVADDHDRQERA